MMKLAYDTNNIQTDKLDYMETENIIFNRKLFFEHLILTFGFTLVCWIPCIILGVNGILVNEHVWIYIPWFLGGFSPTIASFIVLKKNNEVSGFIDWIKHVFDFKHNAWEYLLTLAFPIVQMILMCVLSRYKKGLELYYLPLMILAMIFTGGLEETGWRYITHTELNKKFGYIISAIVTAVIWWIWHLPLFFIPGVSQYGKNFFVFGIMVLEFSFMLATIRELTKSVWLCVLCHAIVNSLGNFYHYDMYGSYLASSITTGIVNFPLAKVIGVSELNILMKMKPTRAYIIDANKSGTIAVFLQ